MNRKFIVLALMATGGCAQQPSVPDVDFNGPLPAVAAEYRTIKTIKPKTDKDEHGAHAAERVEWRFWREPRRMVTENLDRASGELWQLDGSTVIHRKFFHDDKRSIEWQMDDLRMVCAVPSWPRLEWLIDPELLKQLTLKSSRSREGHPVRRYVGTVDGAQWDITLRTDLMLPVSIERRKDGARERTELKNAYAFNLAPWRPTDSSGYEVVDFSDLGDRERDPVLMNIQRQLGQGAVHFH